MLRGPHGSAVLLGLVPPWTVWTGQGSCLSTPAPVCTRWMQVTLCFAALRCVLLCCVVLCHDILRCAVGMSKPVYAVLLRTHQPGCGTTSAIALMTFLIVDTCVFG